MNFIDVLDLRHKFSVPADTLLFALVVHLRNLMRMLNRLANMNHVTFVFMIVLFLQVH